ncbi:MAG TPA: ABC transporter ATP-binding protein [Clostridiales bacterium]|nr:ABC transporter ATP-binding protein [Clostridiales bacterium]
MISLKNIYKSYGKGETMRKVLTDFSLDIVPGDFISIRGRSGCGKSTLLYILGCLETFDSGEYLYKGEDVSKMSEKQLARMRGREIGFVFQSFFLIPSLTCYENIEIPMMYAGIPPKQRGEKIGSLLSEIGMSDYANQKAATLSGGQQQRVAVARALSCDPGIILADEPTGNLDEASGEEVISLFERINRDFGTAVLLVTHDPAIAARAKTQRTL